MGFLLKMLRSGEVGLMTGFAVIGAAWAADELSVTVVWKIGLFFLGVFLLFTAIFSLNSYLGYYADLKNPRLGYLERMSSPRSYLVAVALSSLGATGVFLVLDSRIVAFGVASLVLWTAYSWPRRGIKGVPIAAYVLSFTGEVIHFQMGNLVFREPTLDSWLVALYFSAIFSAGHMHHEVIDRDADRAAGVRTGAVVFGDTWCVAASYCLFLVAALYLAALWILGIVGPALAAPFLVCFVVQSIAWSRFRAAGDKKSAGFRYRTVYRLSHLAAGLVYMMAKWIG